MKRFTDILYKGSKIDQYVFHNLMWPGVYLRGILSNAILQKILTLVPLAADGNEVYDAIMGNFLSDFYDDLDETLNHLNIFKLRIYPGDNVTYLCAEILVDDEYLESSEDNFHICG